MMDVHCITLIIWLWWWFKFLCKVCCFVFAVPPVVLVSPSSQVHIPGAAVSVECQTSGIPQPDITWRLSNNQSRNVDTPHLLLRMFLYIFILSNLYHFYILYYFWYHKPDQTNRRWLSNNYGRHNFFYCVCNNWAINIAP